MNKPVKLRSTEVEGCTVSSIRNVFPEGSYTETRIFTNGMDLDGLPDQTEVDTSIEWEVNHDLAIQMVLDILT